MKICCIFNIAPAYRRSIFTLLQSELGAEIYCGDHSLEGIALLPRKPLTTGSAVFEQELKNRYKGTKLIWQRGAIRRAMSKKYDAYILTGNAGIRSNWIIMLLGRLLGRKVYLWTHGLRGDESPATLRKNKIYFRLATGILLYGHRAEQLLEDQGIKNTTVIYNSLDYDHQLQIREHRGDGGFLRNYFGNDLPTICYLGRLTPNKRLDLLLEAMGSVECNLVIVGGGQMEQELQQMAIDQGVEHRVWFYGECYDEAFLGTLLSNCAATVNPSSIGLTAIHSLTFGTPVITHDHLPSQNPEAEVITSETGFYFRQGDPQSLAQTISLALSRPKPKEECQRIIDQKYNPHVQIEILRQELGVKS